MNTFELTGVVKAFAGNGSKFGYPTANIETTKEAPEGLFVGRVQIDTDWLPAIIFIGAPVTLDDPISRAEAHILDFDQDIYGKTITIRVEQKLRDNEKFNSIESLITQMKIDEQQARSYFSSEF